MISDSALPPKSSGLDSATAASHVARAPPRPSPSRDGYLGPGDLQNTEQGTSARSARIMVPRFSEAPHSAHFRVYRGEQALLTKHIWRGVYSAPRALAQWP